MRFQQIILIIFSLFFLFSCSSPRWSETEGISPDNNLKVSQNVYQINYGDELEIKFFYYPELNDQITVRPDGIIKLQLIPEITAVGLTVKELNDKLIELYSKQIKKPEISIIMREFTGQRIFVGGEVNRPQTITLVGRMDVLQAILQAGGFNQNACKKSVIVISRDESNKPYGRIIDIDGLINGAKGAKNILLKPYDIIVVPKTKIAQLNLFVKQYIRDVLPVQTTIQGGYNYNYSKIK